MSDYFTRNDSELCHWGVVMATKTCPRALLEVDATIGKTPLMKPLAAWHSIKESRPCSAWLTGGTSWSNKGNALFGYGSYAKRVGEINSRVCILSVGVYPSVPATFSQAILLVLVTPEGAMPKLNERVAFYSHHLSLSCAVNVSRPISGWSFAFGWASISNSLAVFVRHILLVKHSFGTHK